MGDDGRSAWEVALINRAAIYWTKEELAGKRTAQQPAYTREDHEQGKAEAVELALYEALLAMGLPAEPPEWMA